MRLGFLFAAGAGLALVLRAFLQDGLGTVLFVAPGVILVLTGLATRFKGSTLLVVAGTCLAALPQPRLTSLPDLLGLTAATWGLVTAAFLNRIETLAGIDPRTRSSAIAQVFSRSALAGMTVTLAAAGVWIGATSASPRLALSLDLTAGPLWGGIALAYGLLATGLVLLRLAGTTSRD